MKQNDQAALQAYVRVWSARRPGWQRLPAEAIAQELANDADFQVLRLAGWLRSPDGELITAIVGAALPYPANLSAKTLADGILIASRQQTQNERLGVTALALLGFALFMFGRD